MPKLLTVDDSKAIRLIVTRHMKPLNVEVDQAEDGAVGLEKLASSSYDLVLLDVTMPNLDGPGMLRQMRERGDKTPVLMLTSESKKSIMVEVMKLGIEDYILKPFKAPEIQAKVKKILGLDGGAAAAEAPAAAAPAAAPSAAPAAGEVEAADILVIDDMVNVEKKFRKLVPQRLAVHGAVDQNGALALCKQYTFKTILLDTDMPDTDDKALIAQLRGLQPKANVTALCMRTRNGAERWAKGRGYDDALYKPFTQEDVTTWLSRYFDDPDLVVANENLVRVGAYAGSDKGVEKYYTRVTGMLNSTFEKLAAACFDEAIVDITDLPLSPERTPKFVLDVHKRTAKFGLDLRIVGTAEGERILKQFTDTGSLPYYNSVAEARSAAS